MFKIKVKSNFRSTLTNKIKQTVDDNFIQEMQREVVEGEIKKLIAAGVSPVISVEGDRRFKGYKDPESYPAKKKAKRPVNLWLSGVMLAWYKAVRVNGLRLTLGIATNAPSDVKTRAEANNIGTVNKKGEVAIAARRFIPLVGETFRVSVVRKIKLLYAQRIKSLVSKK